MKKFFALCLATLLVIVQMPAAFAASELDDLSSDAICSEASHLLSIAAQQQIIPGQENSQINELYLADNIPLYEVDTSNNLVEVTSFKYYPVLDDGSNVRGLVIAKLQDSGVASLEYNTIYCSELNALKNNYMSLCFIFDQTCDYVFDGYNCHVVLQNDIPDMTRGFFNTAGADLSQLERNPIIAKELLELISTADPSTSGQLSVPRVAQSPWDNGCWAACVISAGQYLNPSVNRTVDYIMNTYAYGKDEPKYDAYLPDIIYKEYGVYPVSSYQSLKLTTVINNIGIGVNQGKPIIARAAYNGIFSGHFIVVCGFTAYTAPSTSYVTIMDPLTGDYRMLPTSSSGSSSSEVLYNQPSQTEKYPVNRYQYFN